MHLQHWPIWELDTNKFQRVILPYQNAPDQDTKLVLLRLSKSVPKPRFFGKTEPNRNRGFMPLCWRFRKRSCTSVLTVP